MEWLVLESLTETERRAVLAATARTRYRQGEVLFSAGDAGDSVHLLAAGRVAVRTDTPDGDSVTYAVIGPGEAFGELGLLARDHRRTATVVALEHVETLVLRRERFDLLRAQYPAMDRVLAEILAQRVRRLSAHLLEALYVPVDKRVARRLLALCRLYGQDGAPRVTVPVTQTELAEMAGATRPTVNKQLRLWEDAAVLRLTRGSIEVLDQDRLRRSAR
jgi:CRP/FNR family cyclic AMP-dependent transcriptional regulator